MIPTQTYAALEALPVFGNRLVVGVGCWTTLFTVGFVPVFGKSDYAVGFVGCVFVEDFPGSCSLGFPPVFGKLGAVYTLINKTCVTV